MAAPRVGEQLEVQDPLEGPEQDSGQVAKHIRERSSSMKRKGSSQESAPQKTARLEADECPHLKVIDQNKETFKKVLERLTQVMNLNYAILSGISH